MKFGKLPVAYDLADILDQAPLDLIAAAPVRGVARDVVVDDFPSLTLWPAASAFYRLSGLCRLTGLSCGCSAKGGIGAQFGALLWMADKPEAINAYSVVGVYSVYAPHASRVGEPDCVRRHPQPRSGAD